MMNLKKQIDKAKEIEKAVDREKLVYRATKYTCNLKTFRIIRTFDRDIYEGKFTLKEADENQPNLLNGIRNFRDKARPQNDKKKTRKGNCS